MSKTVLEILAGDLAKNYPDEPQDAESYLRKVTASVEQGLVRLYRKFDTLFIVHETEWHTLHGGSGAELVSACNAFFQQLKDEGMTHISTWYDNPKVSLLAAHAAFKATVTQTNEGKYRTFKLSVEL